MYEMDTQTHERILTDEVENSVEGERGNHMSKMMIVAAHQLKRCWN